MQFSNMVNQCSCSFRTFGPVFLQISNKMDHCCCSFRKWGDHSSCSFRTFENCNNTGGTSLLAVFEHPGFVRKLQQHWWTSLLAVFEHGGPVFLQFSNVRKLQQHWWDQSSCSFRTSPDLFENCNNTGGLVLLDDGLGGPFFLQFSNIQFSNTGFVRKLQQHWWTSPLGYRAGGTSLLAVFEHPGGDAVFEHLGLWGPVSGLWAGFRV